MSIKRYAPRYKKIIKFRQPIWPEKTKKIRKLKRQRWNIVRKVYSVKRFKSYRQDVSSYNLKPFFKEDKFFRIKKRFKIFLRDKQRLQTFYGYGRLRYYQLKTYSRTALKISKNKKVLPATAFFHMMETRLINVFYRLCFASSLMQSKRFINCGHIKVENILVKNSTYCLRTFEVVKLDPAIIHLASINYLRYSFPYLYFRFKPFCCKLINDNQFATTKGFIHSTLDSNLSYFSKGITTLIFYKKHKKIIRPLSYTKKKE